LLYESSSEYQRCPSDVTDSRSWFNGKSDRFDGSNACDLEANCPLHYDTWEVCTCFLVCFDCKRKNSKENPYLNDDCVQYNVQQWQGMQETSERASVQDQRADESKARNQGLAYVGNETNNVQVDDLNTTLDPTKQPLGKLSGLQNVASACKPLSYNVNVNSLSDDSPSIGDPVKANGSSSECIDFSNNNTLAASLNSNTFKSDIAKVAQDASRGTQGLDKDENLKESAMIVNLMCTKPPIIAEGENFAASVDIFCDEDISTMTVDKLAGKVITEQVDDLCKEGLVIRSMWTRNEAEAPCGPEQLTLTRYAVDCCDQNSTTITQTINILPKPPRFIDSDGNALEAGSMDIVVDCTADIFPSTLGYPLYETGCEESVVDINATDSDPVFNPATCETEITRTFTLIQDDCTEDPETFVQVITLRDPYDPVFDFFPPDQSIGVFDPYGTDSTGLPTAFSRCGSSPVIIDYSDTVEDGKDSVERILRRRFTSTDTCNKKTSRDQIITIANNKDDLPLGEKSLYWLYAGEELYVKDQGVGNEEFTLSGSGSKGTGKGSSKGSRKECSIGLDMCSDIDFFIDSPPPPYICGTSRSDEFSDYEDFLAGFMSKPSLDEGALASSCECEIGDEGCENVARRGIYHWNARTELQKMMTRSRSPMTMPVLYGTQQVVSAGTCKETTRQEDCRNAGLLTVVDPQADPPQALRLQGSNPVYNMFTLSASVFRSTIILKVPATSIVLLNIRNSGDIHIPNTARGILRKEYRDGAGVIPTNHILWNIPHGVDLSTRGSSSYSGSSGSTTARAPYDFVGTLLNRRGEMDLYFGRGGKGSSKSSKGVRPHNNTWTGQLFSRRLYADGVDFDCSPFLGFAGP